MLAGVLMVGHLPRHLVGLVAHRRRLLPALRRRPERPLSEPPVIGRAAQPVRLPPEAYGFHTELDDAHTYQSWPWQWLLLGRPVAFYWSGDGACGAPTCAAEILLLGTPLLWWSFLPALAALAWLGIARRDWRAGAILADRGGRAAALVLVALDGRTMFSFYAAPALPFLVLAVVYVLGALIAPAGGDVGDGGAAGARRPELRASTGGQHRGRGVRAAGGALLRVLLSDLRRQGDSVLGLAVPDVARRSVDISTDRRRAAQRDEEGPARRSVRALL